MEWDFNISPEWGFVKTFDEVVADARFCFMDGIQRKHRPMIVLKAPVEGIDCVEIGVDRGGLLVKGVLLFNESYGDAALDLSLDVRGMVRDYLISVGEGGVVVEKAAP